MGITTRRSYAAAILLGALALSACSAPAEEPAQAAETTAATTATPTPTETEKPGPEAEIFNGAWLKAVDTSDTGMVQFNIAQEWLGRVTSSSYGLSGQYSLDGNDPANTAKLWDNYFSDDLKAKLVAAGPNGDVSGFGAWTMMAVAPPESTDPIKASPSCTMEYDSCSMIIKQADGSGSKQGGMRYETMDLGTPNRVAYDYDVVVPVSLTEHGNAEGILRGLLKVDITFVENPAPGNGKPPYLIDSVRNELVDANADLATNSPELSFAGGVSAT